ncbi:DUF192 domain-containing protein [Cereibacter sphaeroides]|uniref:DUF192 domain-containing protein n=1 Tax=Cereibacter sphaeroides TaxID=1063 RepID=UPI000E5BA678|nr:DUF192 domain-containing protein [Cereibacter sphaeroides]RIA00230.1 DUF192 domain-containing protein [Cereibacter sphaeroides]
MGSRSASASAAGLSALALVLALLPGAARADCRPDAVELRTIAGATVRFSVEIADTPAERSRGLMHRESLPRSSGMLFLFDAPHRASFWMRNTLIPLDMIFAGPDGTVKVVHSNAVPEDLTPISGGEGIQSVLEINGGLARALGIGPGTVLRHPGLDQSLAAWPCDETPAKP